MIKTRLEELPVIELEKVLEAIKKSIVIHNGKIIEVYKK